MQWLFPVDITSSIMTTATYFKRCVSGSASSARLFALLLVLFPLSASAAPTPLGCKVNETDGVSLKTSQTMIENTTNKIIAERTVVEATIGVVSGLGRAKFVSSRVAAPSTLQKHDRMSVGDTPRNARSCTANIVLIQPKTVFTDKKPPVIEK